MLQPTREFAILVQAERLRPIPEPTPKGPSASGHKSGSAQVDDGVVA